MSTNGPYRLVSRESHPTYADPGTTRVVRVGSVEVGAGRPVMIAGPCAVESAEQTLQIARDVAAAGGDMLRGGAFKPRTSPYDFQGLAREGLEILAEARRVTGLPIVTEVLDTRDVELVGQYADCFQIGARNMQNFALLREVGRAGKPVLLKRHWAATLTEWLCAAEYIAFEGNLDVMLCERGVRTFSQGDYNRNTLDINVIPAARSRTFLPVLADPSHGTGVASLVPDVALGAIGAGAQGLLIEVIAEATDACSPLCDGFQSIRPSALGRVIRTMHRWREDPAPCGVGEA
jgi:3-deoxy-7-phosphoheptulonate synthase